MMDTAKDIRAGEKTFGLNPRSSAYDQAHYFRERTVLQVSGDLSALPDMSVGAPTEMKKGGHFVSLLTETGHLDADFYMAPYEDGALIDVHVELAKHVADRLAAMPGVTGLDRDAGNKWRLFGELPDQSNADTPFETIRFMDPRRRELGCRVFRDSAEPEGMDWRHARKWDGHAMRLGLLPDHRCVIGKEISPEEAGYHRLFGDGASVDARKISRRILPVRIDVYGNGVPKLKGATVYGGDEEIATMLDHEGICGIALVDLQSWRDAVAAGLPLSCEGLPTLISWPTWLASESEGRVGPAAGLI